MYDYEYYPQDVSFLGRPSVSSPILVTVPYPPGPGTRSRYIPLRLRVRLESCLLF